MEYIYIYIYIKLNVPLQSVYITHSSIDAMSILDVREKERREQ